MEPADDPATVLRPTHRPLPLLPRGGTQTPHNRTRRDALPQAISPPALLQDARLAAGTLFPPRLDPSGRWRRVPWAA